MERAENPGKDPGTSEETISEGQAGKAAPILSSLNLFVTRYNEILTIHMESMEIQYHRKGGNPQWSIANSAVPECAYR
jgi:hypothetical protein